MTDNACRIDGVRVYNNPCLPQGYNLSTASFSTNGVNYRMEGTGTYVFVNSIYPCLMADRILDTMPAKHWLIRYLRTSMLNL